MKYSEWLLAERVSAFFVGAVCAEWTAQCILTGKPEFFQHSAACPADVKLPAGCFASGIMTQMFLFSVNRVFAAQLLRDGSGFVGDAGNRFLPEPRRTAQRYAAKRQSTGDSHSDMLYEVHGRICSKKTGCFARRCRHGMPALSPCEKVRIFIWQTKQNRYEK